MSRKSGIFNFIKLPNLMVGLVAACVCFICGDVRASMVSHSNSLAKSSSYTGDVKYFGGKAYRCEVNGYNNDYKFVHGNVIQAIDNDMYAYKCVDVEYTVNDKWVRVDTQYCNDTQLRSVSTEHTEICVYKNGQKQKCKKYGEYFDNSKWEAYLKGCVKVTCVTGYHKEGNQCVENCVAILGDEEVDCPSEFANAKTCVKTCVSGKWKTQISECIDDTYKLSQNRDYCFKQEVGYYKAGPMPDAPPAPPSPPTNPETTTSANTTTPAASSGDCNTPKEKEDRGAVEIKKQGALCVATKCKPDHYKVKDASGAYQGWCIYKKCPAGHHVDTGTDGMVLANDTKCVADTPADAEPKVEASDDADTKTSAAAETGETTSDPAPEQETPAPAGPADGEECNKPGARQAEYRNGKCVAMECDDGYEPSGDNCVEISGPCESLPAHAVRGHREYNTDTGDVECIIEDCDDGYVVADDKLSCHEDYDAQAEAAREREQSTGNKLLGAVGMGATGIGGSMLMSGLAESAADDDAERAMTAYLGTFTCKYGNESVSGGTMNVEIPGGNELINMYSEYVALANDLKLRKAALGMKPGIESEPILDSATSGLYDDVGTGRGKGVYASLARALENPDGEDAKAWAAQREESEKKKKTGAIVAGIGAVGSLIGNLAINADWGKNKHKALRDLEEDVNNIRPSRDRCPDDADGTYAPDCDCSGVGRVYNANMNRCDACPSGMIARNNSCECPQANQIYVSGQCVDAGATVGRDNGTGADVVPSLQTAVLSADAMFAYGRYELRREALDALDEFINNLRNVKSSNCRVKVVGYADPSGSDSANLTLSKNRASNVAYYLRRNVDNVILEDEGRGEANCTCGLRSKIEGADTGEKGYVFCKDKADDTIVQNGLRYAPCRRVEIQMQNCELESDVAAALGQGAGEIAGSALGSLTTAVTGQ